MEKKIIIDELNIYAGDTLGKLYKVRSLLDEGGYGVVIKCHNIQTEERVAIKINRNDPEAVQQIKEEIATLKKLRCLDPDTCNIVRWNGFFFNRENICLSFELLDQSLLDYMTHRKNCYLPITVLKVIIHQVTTALFHLNSIGIIHSDIKPENVMIVDRNQCPLKVKLIDFGLALHVSVMTPSIVHPRRPVQTTWYRAPEVILGNPLNEAIDMWSLGLLTAELAIGFPLYPGIKDYDVLRFIILTQGQPEDSMVDRGMSKELYFSRPSNSQQHWRFKTPVEFARETGYHTKETRRVKLRSLNDIECLLMINTRDHIEKDLLLNLIKEMLELDPKKRIKSQEALQHLFFTQSLPNDLWNEEEDLGVSAQNIQSREEEQVDVQNENKARSNGWFRCLIGRITQVFAPSSSHSQECLPASQPVLSPSSLSASISEMTLQNSLYESAHSS